MKLDGYIRLDQLRLKLRVLLVIVAVFAFLFWIIPRWETDSGVSQAIGHVSIPLVFIVSEADSGQLIEGAIIRLRDPDCPDSTSQPDAFELKTGRDGRVTTLVDLTFNESRGIPSGRLRFYRVVYPPWEIKVSADGYLDFVAAFADFESNDRRFHENAPPPPLKIRLRRRSQSDTLQLRSTTSRGLTS